MTEPLSILQGQLNDFKLKFDYQKDQLLKDEQLKEKIQAGSSDQEVEPQEIVQKSHQQIKTSPKCFFQYLKYFYHEQFKEVLQVLQVIHTEQKSSNSLAQNQQKQKINSINKNLKIQQHFQKSYSHLNTLRQQQIKSIQQKILSNECFRRHSSFTQKLEILNIKHSRHYEIVTIQVHLLSYTLKIQILNKTSQSAIHKYTHLHGSGAFGNVYTLNHQNQQFAVKCMPFYQKVYKNNRQNKFNIRYFRNILQEYFYLKLFQLLRIGPNLKQIYGFDLVVFSQCIQFSMEVCYNKQVNQNDIQKLKQKIKIMHLLKVVHKDMKPCNIMYSPSLKQFILIDFGGSRSVKENIGLKSKSQFFGTNGYFSNQMKNLLQNNLKVIDMYYNDLFGFKQTIKEMKQYKEQQQILSIQNIIEQSNFYIWQNIYKCQLRYNLFKKMYSQFLQNWQALDKLTFLTIEIKQNQIMQFLTELIPDQKIRSMFRQIIQPQFVNIKHKGLLKTYTGNQSCQVFDLSSFEWKQDQFKNIIIFYKALQILQNNKSNEQQKIIRIILLKKTDIQLFLNGDIIFTKGFGFDILDSKNIYQNLTLKSYVLLHYCTFSANYYNANVNQKINEVEKYFKFVQQLNIYQQEDFQLIFVCPFQNLQKIAKFFQFFALKIWKQLPFSLKVISFKICMISLILVGYPIRLLEAKNFIENNFISSNQSRQRKIFYFWNLFLISITYGRILIDQSQRTFIKQVTQQRSKQIHALQTEIMEMEQDKFSQFSNFYKINKNIYEHIITNFKSLNILKYSELNKYLRNLNYNDLKIQKQQIMLSYEDSQQLKVYFNQWKYKIQIILTICFIIYECNLTYYQKINFIQQISQLEQISLMDKNENQLRFFNFIDIISHKHDQTELVFYKFMQKFQRVINCNAISNRFCIFEKIQLSLKKCNWSQYKKLVYVVIKQMIQIDRVSLIYMGQILNTLFQIILNLMSEYVGKQRDYLMDFQLFISIINKAYEFTYFYVQKGLEQELRSYKLSKQNNLSEQNITITSQKQSKYIKTQQNVYQSRQFNWTMKNNQQIIIVLLQFQKQLQIICSCMITLISNLMKNQQSNYLKQLLTQYLQKLIQKGNTKEKSGNTREKPTNKNITQDLLIYHQADKLIINLKKIYQLSIKFYHQIENSRYLKQIVQSNSQAKHSYLKISIIQISQLSDISNNKHLIIDLIQSLYRKLNPLDFKNQNPKNLPSPSVSFEYFVSKIQLSHYQIKDYIKIYQFYQSTKQMESFQSTWITNSNTHYIFNALIYCQIPMIQFHHFFTFLTDLLKKYPNQQHLNTFNYNFQNRLSCFCRNCYPLETFICINKKVLQIINLLKNKIEKAVTENNSYMALVYLYCLKNNSISKNILNKMLIFINSALQYLPRYVKQKILENIFIFKLKLLEFNNNIKNSKRVNFQQVFYQKKRLKYQNKFYFISDIVQLHFKFSCIEAGINDKAKVDCLNKKIKRFYQINQNYKIRQQNKSNQSLLQVY